MQITPEITTEDVFEASQAPTYELANPGIYDLAIGGRKEGEGAAVELRTSGAGNQYLSVCFVHTAEEFKGHQSVWSVIMLGGTDKKGRKIASYSSNFAGFIAALGFKDVPTIETLGASERGEFATLSMNGDNLGLLDWPVRAKLDVVTSTYTDSDGKEKTTTKNVISAFLPPTVGTE